MPFPSSWNKAGVAGGLAVSLGTAGFTGLASVGAFIVAALAAITSAVIVVVHWREWVEWVKDIRRRGKLGLLIATLVSGFAFAVFLGLLIRPEKREPVSEASAPSQMVVNAAVRVVVECELVGEHEQIPGTNSTLLVFPTPGQNPGGTAMAKYSGKVPVKAGEMGITHRCRLTNYAPVALTNLRIPIELNFYEPKVTRTKTGTTLEQGKHTISRIGFVTLPRLDAGPQSSFDFFIGNSGRELAVIIFPDRAEAQRVDSDKLEVVGITTTMNLPIQSWPPAERL